MESENGLILHLKRIVFYIPFFALFAEQIPACHKEMIKGKSKRTLLANRQPTELTFALHCRRTIGYTFKM